MPTNAPNPSEDQEDPELEMMDPLTNDIEKSLKRDFKRIRQDKYKEAQKGQRLKKADFDFEVDSVEKISNDTPKTEEEKSTPQKQALKSQSQGSQTKNTETPPTPKTSPSTPNKIAPTPERASPIKENGAEPGADREVLDEDKNYYQDTNTSEQDQTTTDANETVDDESTDSGVLDENAAPKNIPLENPLQGAATRENPMDSSATSETNQTGADGKTPQATPEGAATGDNPFDPMKQGGNKAEMAKQAGVDTNESGAEIDPRTGQPIKNPTEGATDLKAGQPDDKTEKEKAIARQLKEKQQANKYVIAQKAAMMASMMTGGANLPKSGAGGGKEAFKAGGGPSDPSQFDAQKKPAGGMKGAAQKAGAAVGGAMDKGKQAADAVKRQVDAAKQAAKNVKNAITAPARKLAAAKAAVSNFMDSMNPIKRLKKLFKSVSITQLIGGLIRLLLTSKGFGKFVEMFDKLVKEENANRCYTCCFCSNCLIQALIPFLPLMLIILIAAAAVKA